MTYNVEALTQLRKTLEAEARRGRHNQGIWGGIAGQRLVGIPTRDYKGDRYAVSCPTMACAAGWAVTNAGAQMLFEADCAGADGRVTANFCLTEDGDVRAIANYAMNILGLDTIEADKLFYYASTTEQVLRYLEEILVAAAHGRTWTEQVNWQQNARMQADLVRRG